VLTGGEQRPGWHIRGSDALDLGRRRNAGEIDT
jgi:hypothetical protein